jgi:hypothetical protein
MVERSAKDLETQLQTFAFAHQPEEHLSSAALKLVLKLLQQLKIIVLFT